MKSQGSAGNISPFVTPSAWLRPRGRLGRLPRQHYDNPLAEAPLFKAELVRNKVPWKGIDDLESAVAEYIDWSNHRRLRGEIGLVPPADYEDTHYRHNPAPTPVGALVQSLH